MKEKFLLALAACASVTRSCEQAKIPRRTVYTWRDADPDFRAAWEVAVDLGTDALEDEATRRAFEGTDKPVYQGGELVGHVREYSDTLLIFMLKARRPAKFRERVATEITGANGGPIQHQHTGTIDEFRRLPLDERIQRLRGAISSPSAN